MKIPPAAIAAPQVTTIQAVPGRGFAQALFAAGLTDPVSSLPSPLPTSLPIPAASGHSAKTTKQQPSKEPAKDASKRAVAVPVTTPLQATLAPPLRILPFSREAESHEPNSSAVREVTVPAETPAAPPALDATLEVHAEKPQTAPSAAASADSVREMPKPPAPENPPAAPSGELTFAARVQPAQAPIAEPPVSPRPLQHDTAAPEPVKRPAEKDLTAETPVIQPIAAGADTSLLTQGQHGQYAHPELTSDPSAVTSPAVTSEPAAPAAPPQPAEIRVAEAQSKAAAAPLKDLSVQVAQQGNQKVEVRMVQQAGELHVSVRTGDSDLAHGLQQGLPELVGRLQENGFRAEAWRPGAAVVQSGPELEARTNTGGSQNGEPQSNSGGSHQQQGERRQNPSQRPGWVEELENTIATGANSQGASYGIGS